MCRQGCGGGGGRGEAGEGGQVEHSGVRDEGDARAGRDGGSGDDAQACAGDGG